jgi:nitrogen regulatory protein P-II 1
VELPSKLRVEIVCPDESVETIVNDIYKSLHTDQRADGKIFVLPVDDALRVKTGERGNAALGPTPGGTDDLD